MKRIGDLDREIKQRLTPVYGGGEAAAIARVIWEDRKKWLPVDVAMHVSEAAGPALVKDITDMLERLVKGEPVQYVLGESRFFGLRLKVDRNTLIPRPETEELVQMVIDDAGGRSDLRVLDVGTGSGAIALALARNLPFSRVTGVDISPGALALARENARTLNVRGASFISADILAAPDLGKDFDIVVSNPPYVLCDERDEMSANVLDYEPASAIFAPCGDPLAFYRAITATAKGNTLRLGGRLYFELNPLTAGAVLAEVEKAGFRDAVIVRDIHGRQRFLSATKPER